MKLSTFLKQLLNEIVDVYQQQLRKTYGLALILAICTAAAVLVLVRYTGFDKLSLQSHNSLIGFFYYRYSDATGYRLVDLSKIIFLFSASFFSVAVYRSKTTENKTHLTFGDAIQTLKINDVTALSITLVVTVILDCIINFAKNLPGNILSSWENSLFFHLRIYLPAILFSVTLSRLLIAKRAPLGIRNIFLLLAGLWLFNEFSYEVYLFINSLVFKLIFVSLEAPDKYFIFEGIGDIFIIAFFFPGFYAVMVYPFRLFAESIKEPLTKLSSE